MKSRVGTLTQRFVDRFEDSGGQDLFITDDKITGLGVRLYPSGVKSYFLRYTQHGLSNMLKLGDARVITLADAKELAAVKRRDVALGLDPHRRGARHLQFGRCTSAGSRITSALTLLPLLRRSTGGT